MKLQLNIINYYYIYLYIYIYFLYFIIFIFIYFLALYVAECLGMVVGFAVLNTYNAPDVLIEQFNIEKYCTKENHHFTKKDEFILSCIIMNPLYENKARYFLEVNIFKKYFFF